MKPCLMVGAQDLLHITLMGQFRLCWGKTAVHHLDTPSHQALFAYLVLHADQTHTRQHLAFTFWPSSSEGQARTNLRKAIHHLRQTVPAEATFLEVDRHSVTWHKNKPYTLDVTEFEAAVVAAQTAVPAARRCYLTTAIDRYHGELLPGHYEQWILAYREMLRQQYLGCLVQLIELLEAERDYAAAADYARRLLRADPLHEAAYRRLMRLQALNNDWTDALRVYEQCAANLQRELHVLPSAPTRAAYHRLLTMETSPESQGESRSPLVGRARAWHTLQKSWQRAVRKRPMFVLLQGEAGIGKTRLAEEMLDWTARQGMLNLEAAGHAPTETLPYAPLAGWLRSAAVRQSLSNLPDVWLSEISRLLPELLIERPDLAAPNPIQEAWQQQRFFTALAHVILGLPQPILLFMDDLQWCQPDVWNWFCFLLHFEPRARFMLLGAIRDEAISDNQLFSRLCHDCRHDGSFVQIGLGRLNQLATAELAQQIAGETLAPEQIACIYDETEGVPLLVVALAARLAGNVALEVDKEPWGMPERMRALVEEPLASLSPAAQEVAALGAVIGRTFSFDLLAAVSGKPETGLIEALEELCRRCIVREHEAGSYTFSHNMLHQAIYTRLSQPKQRLLREKINAELARRHAPATLTF